MPKQPESKHFYRKAWQDWEGLARTINHIPRVGPDERMARIVMDTILTDNRQHQGRLLPNNRAAREEAFRYHPDPKPLKRLGSGRRRRRVGRGRKRAAPRRRKPVRRGSGRRRTAVRRRRR